MCRKKRRRPPGLANQGFMFLHCWLGLLAWPWLAWLSSPRTGLARLACTNCNERGAGNRAASAKAGRRPMLSMILGWAPSGAQPKITQGGRRLTSSRLVPACLTSGLIGLAWLGLAWLGFGLAVRSRDVPKADKSKTWHPGGTSQLQTTSERSSGLPSVAWEAWHATLEAERPEY